MDFIGVLAIIGWLVFKAISSKKKQENASNRPPPAQRGVNRPVPNKAGTWADMLGIPSEATGGMLGKLNESFQLPVNKPKESVPTLEPVAEPVFDPLSTYHYESMEGKSYTKEGDDDCHAYMLEPAQSTLTFSTPVLEEQADAKHTPGWTLGLDAPALVQGVIFAEILARPVQRWRGRR